MKKKLPKILTQDEIKKLLSMFNLRYKSNYTNYLAIKIMSETGIRVNELVNIKRENINFLLEGKTLIEKGKGGEQRYTYLNADIRKHLERYWERIGPSEWALSTFKGTQLLTNSIRRAMKDKAKKADKQYGCNISWAHPHSLRHSLLTSIYEDSKDILLTKAVAGHSSIQSTQIYISLSASAVKDALLNR